MKRILVFSLMVAAASSSPAAEKPNIVFILADDKDEEFSRRRISLVFSANSALNVFGESGQFR